MQQVLEKIGELHLDDLDDSWVENIHDSEFMDYEELPAEYASILEQEIPGIFNSIMVAVESWLRMETDDNDVENTWATLSHQFRYRKLLAVLGYFIHEGTNNVLDIGLRSQALYSARLYFTLLSIPGCRVYNVYHSQLFAHSLACLEFPKIICDKYEDEKRQSKSNRQKLNREEEEERKRNEKIFKILKEKEVNLLIIELQPFVKDLRAIIEQIQIEPRDMNFEEILSNLVEVTGGPIVSALDVDRIEFSKLTEVIYEVIDILVHNSEKQLDPTGVKLLFKCLHIKLVAVCSDTRASNAKASYIAYLVIILGKFGQPVFENFLILLEHLGYAEDDLDRSEVRVARVEMIKGLMTVLPEIYFDKFVKWIILLSQTIKLCHRRLALNLMEQMLRYEDGGKTGNSNQRINMQQICSTGNEENGNPINAEEQGSNTENGPNSMNVNEDAQETNEAAEIAEPEVTFNLQPVLHARTITVQYSVIIRAVFLRVNDESCYVRIQAVGILTKCLDNTSPAMKQALTEMQGDLEVSRLMAVAARSVCDGNALVRRAGVALMHRLLEAQDSPPLENDLGMLLVLCRDASVSVRLAAINGLAALVLTRPSVAVVAAFLSGPLRQISDAENKVHLRVSALIEDLLVYRIKTYNSCHEDPIPWMMLAGIIQHNMRQHLQKAITQVAKNSDCISVGLVDCLSTHLDAPGADRDLQALVMLTCVADHVEYADISFTLQYYYKQLDVLKTEGSDPRRMMLTLELLGSWARFAQDDERVALREQLVSRLAAPSNDGCRIASAVLAAQLDPSNLGWATELMQQAERSALNGGGVEEWLRAADLSLVSPTPPSPQLLELFFTTLNNLPSDWSHQHTGECVAGAGRLSLRSRSTALSTAPLLAPIMHAAAPLQARINALMALSDICTRYTCIVEPLLEQVCRCLECAAPVELRQHAACALTRLLLSGYLRLRPPLYFKYYALVADEVAEVREPVEYYVTYCLRPDTIFQYFVDCVRYYNSDKSDTLRCEARQLTYDLMLQRLSLVQKLNMQCRLAKEVLEEAADVVDQGEQLDESMNTVLMDTILVLSGPRMRLPTKRQKSTNGDMPDIDEIRDNVTTNLVSDKMKLTVVEVVIPAVLRLHAGLRASGGQVVTYLVQLINYLKADYRNEIEELIKTEPELMDQLQQFEETIELEPSDGNARNLVTTSAPPEPETPRPRHRRSAIPPSDREVSRKRSLLI